MPFLHLAVFSFAPLAFTVYLAFHEWGLLEKARPFVGLANFRELAHDPLFWSTLRNTALYTGAVSERDRSFNGSALFAYRLNWQTVLFVGYGDSRALSDANRLVPAGREFFVKASYAFQE